MTLKLCICFFALISTLGTISGTVAAMDAGRSNGAELA